MGIVTAQKCCNYDSGNCLGVFFEKREKGLVQWADKNFAGKPCVVRTISDENKCEFYRRFVIGGKK